MPSREQANVIGDVLVAAAEAERVAAAERSTQPMVRMYPALKAVPALERHAALRDAREFAATHGSSRWFLTLISIAFAAVVALGVAGQFSFAVAAGALVAALFVARQYAELSVMRRYLATRFASPPDKL
jgi:predicted Kef-type K+ transport protein